MAIGPVQSIVLGFSQPDFHGEIIAELERLRESDTVRVVDALAVHKDAVGEVEPLRRRRDPRAPRTGRTRHAPLRPTIVGRMPAQLRGATREIPGPRRGGRRPLRPRLRRLTDMPAETSVPVHSVPEVGYQPKTALWQALCRVCRLPLPEDQPQSGQELATKHAGLHVGGIPPSACGHIRSLLALLTTSPPARTGRSPWLKIPPTTLKPDYHEPARAFCPTGWRTPSAAEPTPSRRRPRDEMTRSST
jgi:hypothetical protein